MLGTIGKARVSLEDLRFLIFSNLMGMFFWLLSRRVNTQDELEESHLQIDQSALVTDECIEKSAFLGLILN